MTDNRNDVCILDREIAAEVFIRPTMLLKRGDVRPELIGLPKYQLGSVEIQ